MKDAHKQIMTGKIYASAEEVSAYKRLLELSKQSPIPEREFLGNLGLFLNRGSFSHMIFLHNLYMKVINTHGIIVEFGVRWGQNMALFATLRHMYEPYNISRKIIGFDTFEGLTGVSQEDGPSETAKEGLLSVTEGYEQYLEELLSTQERLAPRSHLKKYELIKGDVTETLPIYLEKHPETIIALAYFDLVLYEPTKICLELIQPYLTKNSIIGFDELVLAEFPGETKALRETWGLSNYRISRDPVSPQQSYLTFQ